VTVPQPPAPEPSLPASDPLKVAPPDAGLSEHARRNRAAWNADADDYQARHGRQLAGDGKAWGTWNLPESELHVLGEVAGRDVLELGCGAAQGSIDLARAGARPVGLDLSEGQLDHARRLLAQAGAQVSLVQASAKAVPLADASFDIVFCDHGAMTFADPFRTVPEVARVLRPGGLFAFNMATPLIWLCWGDGDEPPGPELVRSYFGMRRETWETVEFQLPYGEWIRLFRSNDLEILDLIELRPPARPRTTYTDYAPLEWSRRWPGEHIWKLRKSG
jgi:SAM-dependent methyltransferase